MIFVGHVIVQSDGSLRSCMHISMVYMYFSHIPSNFFHLMYFVHVQN